MQLKRVWGIEEEKDEKKDLEKGLFSHLFCDHDQLVRGEQGDLFALAGYQAIFFPLAQCAADGVQRGAGHLGQVLAGEVKIDQNTMIQFAPGLFCQAQHSAGDPSINAFGSQLAKAVLEFLDACSQ